MGKKLSGTFIRHADRLRHAWTDAKRKIATHKDKPAYMAVGGKGSRGERNDTCEAACRALHEQTSVWLSWMSEVVRIALHGCK